MRKFCVFLMIGIMLAGCRSQTVPEPTTAPSVIPPSITLSPSPSPSPAGPQAATPTFRPMITPTSLPTEVAVAPSSGPTQAPTRAQFCITAKAGDTLYAILMRGNYGDLSGARAAFRELNNMAPGSDNIQVGVQYCLPETTQTPTPEGYDLTRTVIAQFLPTSGAQVYQDYLVKTGDTTLLLEIKFGIPLGQICRLNTGPDGLNCAGCKLDAPIYNAGCRVLLRVGQTLRVPGPTPTPSITPTLTGSETYTPTPAYSAPRILAPQDGAMVSGDVRLRWLPGGGILQADEVYLVLMSESPANGTPRNVQYTTQATSWLLPAEYAPADNNPHTIYWQVGVARLGPDGSAILISEKSQTVSFTWIRP